MALQALLVDYIFYEKPKCWATTSSSHDFSTKYFQYHEASWRVNFSSVKQYFKAEDFYLFPR